MHELVRSIKRAEFMPEGGDDSIVEMGTWDCERVD